MEAEVQGSFIKEGDNNTRFFHRIANSHRRTNQIRGVEVDGVLFEDESDVTDQVVDFYKRLYQEPEAWRPTIDGLEFVCLDETERSMLEREFEKEEIIEALKEVEGDKALGPDGFTMAFYQKCWSVLEGMYWLSSKIFTASVFLRNLLMPRFYV